MSRLTRWLAPSATAHAHCDLPCGVYDPEQARIEAESCFRIMDYFKPEHVEKVPNLHDLFWNASKAASKVKASVDPADGRKLLDAINDIDAAWKATGGLEKTRVAGRPG